MNIRWYLLLSRFYNKLALWLVVGVIIVGGVSIHHAKAAQAPRQASILVDARTGTILYQDNADERTYPASLTKIMTLYMLFGELEAGRLSLTSRLSVSSRAESMAPSVLGVKQGESITVETAILAVVTRSANDVAVVIAEAIGGTEANFARMMTQKARSLGMSRTNFANASGLPNLGQLTTARDMAKLAIRVRQDFPDYFSFFSRRDFIYEGVSIPNHNRLLGKVDGVDGIKTGFIRASGFNLVASATRNGQQVVGVIFGGKTAKERDKAMERLLDRGFMALNGNLPPNSSSLIASQTEVTKSTPKPPKSISGLASADTKAKPKNKSAEPPQMAEGDYDEATDPNQSLGAEQWGIQIGAFSTHNSANKAAKKAFDLLLKTNAKKGEDGAKSYAVLKDEKSRHYRAVLTGLSKSSATQSCQRLKRQGQSCFVMELG